MEDTTFDSIEEYLRNPVEKPSILTDQDVQIIILGSLRGAEPDGLSEETLEKIVNWVAMAKLNEAIANLALKGVVYLGWDGGEVTMKLADNVTL